LAKKLRLAAAGLTDVGRRREHNQDNVTHYVPPDENELAAKGALFVVCDGMGGHAAGEVASELGVNAIREVYYASTEEDVIDNIASAIRAANDKIYEYAQQHPESKGMGTTCVSVLIHGGRAYFVNIGDSRAYLVRDDDMRQVTLDHSWVAEQVRAGLLSEEQARTHAHRNVITRSLGTGPSVTADLFVESLKQGDRILLCSDGLHGYVDEREIKREMLTLSEPEAGVQALVDMANSNGGPDNITALVIHLLEVPPVTGELSLPVAGSQDEQTITQPVPAVPASAARASKVASSPHKAYSAKLPVADFTKNKARTGNPVATLSIRLLGIAAVLVILAGVWDITLGPYAQMYAATQQLQSTISHARQVVSRSGQLDPSSALATLSQARAQLVTGLENTRADPQVRQSARQLLNTQVASAVQNAVNRYDTAALIVPIASSAIGLRNVSCSTPTSQSPVPLNAISSLVAVTPTGVKPNSPLAATQTLYAISSGLLYQMVVPADTSTGKPTLGTVTCTQLAVQSVSTVLALASDGETLLVLAQQNPTTYEVLIYSPNGTSPSGQPLLKAVAHFGVPISGGTVPALIAAKGATTYVTYSKTGGAPGIWIFTGTKPRGPAKTIPLNQAANSIVATNNTLYAILADGSLGQLDSHQAFQPIQVAIQPPLIPSTPTNYTSATPVPTVANTSATGGSSGNTTFRGGDVISADADDSTTIYIDDTAPNRVVRFSASGTGPGLGLADQFTYGGSVSSINQLALAANGSVLNVYGWSGSQLASFSIDEPKAGS
jgi:serine/threonine protein phosphatase PrpC